MTATPPPLPAESPRRGGGAGLRLVAGAAREDGPDSDTLSGLVRAVALDHDHDAFARLFEHFAPRMKSWLMRSGSPAEAADELVQDAFVALWRKAAQFDPARSTVAAWLFTIARNLRIDRYRGLCDTWLVLDEDAMLQARDPGRGLDELCHGREQALGVRWALGQLTPDQRQLVQLSYVDDLSHSLIAQELRLPLGTVKTRIRRAAARLRLLLEEYRS